MFYWEEEGPAAEFAASPVAGNEQLVHLKITYSREEEKPWIDAELEKDVIVEAFLPPLLDMAKNFNKAEYKWGLAYKNVAE